MTREEMVSAVGKPILIPLGLLQGVFIIAIVASPILWIWMNFGIALKVGLTGVFGSLIIYAIYSVVKKTIGQAIDEQIAKSNGYKPKSKFQQRLDELKNK